MRILRATITTVITYKQLLTNDGGKFVLVTLIQVSYKYLRHVEKKIVYCQRWA